MQSHNFPALSFQDFIASDAGRLTTDSMKVVAVFGKQHSHVLRDIRRLLAQLPDEDRLSNFGESAVMRENPSGGAMIQAPVFSMSKVAMNALEDKMNPQLPFGPNVH